MPAPVSLSTLFPQPTIISVPFPSLKARVATPKSATLFPSTITSSKVKVTLYFSLKVSSSAIPK